MFGAKLMIFFKMDAERISVVSLRALGDLDMQSIRALIEGQL